MSKMVFTKMVYVGKEGKLLQRGKRYDVAPIPSKHPICLNIEGKLTKAYNGFEDFMKEWKITDPDLWRNL